MAKMDMKGGKAHPPQKLKKGGAVKKAMKKK